MITGVSIPQLLIYVVIIAACAGLVYVALRQFGVAIPDWVIQVVWITVVAFVIIFAIKLVSSMGSEIQRTSSWQGGFERRDEGEDLSLETMGASPGYPLPAS